MANITTPIPEKTIERLSEYRRTLLKCHAQGITHIFSHVLAGMHGITAVQVRRDLMLIGFSSDTKKGYDVKVLIDFIDGILYSEQPINMAIIGMGHLGQALTKYFNGKVCIFLNIFSRKAYNIPCVTLAIVLPCKYADSVAEA